MAAIRHMTWDWKWKVTATGVTALAGWFASPPLQPEAARTPVAAVASSSAAQSAANAAAVSDIAEEARRLSRTTARTSLPAADRNPFQFRPKPSPPRPAALVQPQAVVPIAPAVPPPFPLRLTGIAVDVVNGVEHRTAIISGPSSLEIAADGEAAAPGYRVVSVGDSFADVERVSDGSRQRLALKP